MLDDLDLGNDHLVALTITFTVVIRTRCTEHSARPSLSSPSTIHSIWIVFQAPALAWPIFGAIELGAIDRAEAQIASGESSQRFPHCSALHLPFF